MKPEELEQLLGGYATGTLTPEEQKALFEAALRDQSLFDALAREQALKEALDQPSLRKELLAELEQSRPGWRERLAVWFQPRYPIAAGAVAVAALVTVVSIVKYSGPAAPPPPTVEIAQSWTPEPFPNPAGEAVGPSAPKSAPVVPKRKAVVQPSPPQTALLDAENTAPERQGPQPGASAPPVAGGVVGGVVSSSPAAAPPPPPPPAAEKAASAFRSEAVEQAAPLRARDASVPSFSLRHSISDSGRIVVEASAGSVIYAFRRADSGEWIPVTPGGLSLQAGFPTTLPDIEPRSAVLLVLSRTPMAELARNGAALQATLQNLRSESRRSGLVLVDVPPR